MVPNDHSLGGGNGDAAGTTNNMDDTTINNNNVLPADVGDVFEISDHNNATTTNNNNDDDDDNNNVGHSQELDQQCRQGTISSARFNILSTMVGGGCLSLPLAFNKAGNGFLGPLLLIITACITHYVFTVHITSARLREPNKYYSTNTNRLQQRGHDSFEKMASIAFGSSAFIFCMILVTLMCFFGIVAYAVLLRDMLQPINDYLFHIHRTSNTDPSLGLQWHDNVCMWIIVFFITPACTLQTLTSLKKFGALGMCSVFILGCCIFFRSGQCMIEKKTFVSNFQMWPNHWKDVLDVLPLYISCYVCHYNLLPVHNELQHPTQYRVNYWLSTTVWVSTLFYCVLGLAGSVYGKCIGIDTELHGNILLDFPEDDPLLFLGRLCLAITITLAFPMLTIPARDIFIRNIPNNAIQRIKSFVCCCCRTSNNNSNRHRQSIGSNNNNAALTEALNLIANATLTEALLENEYPVNTSNDEDVENLAQQQQIDDVELTGRPMDHMNAVTDNNNDNNNTEAEDDKKKSSFMIRLCTSVFLFWTATALASCVSSIDVVWDLLGSSLSILLSYLIPCSCYIVICRQQREILVADDEQQQPAPWSQLISLMVSWLLLLIFTPLMFISSANAIYDTFYHN